MENVVIDFTTKNEEILYTIELLEKIGQVEKGTAEEFRKSAAIRKAANEAAAQAQVEAYEANLKSQKSLEGLSASLKDINKTIAGGALGEGMKGLQLSIQNTEAKTTSLKAQLRAMKAELATLPEGTAQFNKLSISAAKLEDKIGDVARRVRNLASDTKGIDAIISGAQGVTGAFAVAEGATAIFGSKNEELQKTLLKVNAAMAILQGLQQLQAVFLEESAAKSYLAATGQAVYTAVIGTSTGAMKAFRIALASTGIGLIVLAVAALIANFSEVKKVVMDTFPALNGFGKIWDKLKAGYFGFIKAYIEGWKIIGDLIADVWNLDFNKLAKDASNAGARLSKAYNDGFKKEEDSQAEDRRIEAIKNSIETQKRLVALTEAQGRDSYALKRKLLKDEATLLEKHRDDDEKAENDYQDKLNEIRVLDAQKSKQDLEVRNQASLDVMREGQEKELAAQKIAFDKRAIELRNAGVSEKVIAEINNKEIFAINDKYYKDSIAQERAYQETLKKEQDRIYADARSTREKVSADLLADINDYYHAQENALKIQADNDLSKRAELNMNLLLLNKQRIEKEMANEKISDADYLKLKKEKADNELAIEDEKAAKKKQLRDAENQLSIDSITALQTVNSAYLDWEIGRLDEQLAKKQISEDQYAQKVKAAKRQQAIDDKALSAFKIVLSTSEAIIKFLADPGGPAGVVLSVAAGITGAAELTAVLSKPIPGFKKGTKNAPAGWAWVGEEGPELKKLKGGEQIMPHKESVHFAKMYFDSQEIKNAFPAIPNIILPASASVALKTPEMDYKKMAKAFSQELGSMPAPEFNIYITDDVPKLKYTHSRYGN